MGNTFNKHFILYLLCVFIYFYDTTGFVTLLYTGFLVAHWLTQRSTEGLDS